MTADQAVTKPRLRAQKLGKLANLARVYWYTMEFGLVKQADGLDDLLDLAKIDFAPLYEQLEGKPDIAAGQLLAEDVLFNRGTGNYHAHKRSIQRG